MCCPCPQIGEIVNGKAVARCAHIWHACVDCGKERWVQLRKGQPKRLRCKSCARKLGTVKLKEVGEHIGYIKVSLKPDDFFYPMCNKSGQVREHRLVMAKHLNRCLLPWEVVHHKNGIKDDNRLENVELISHNRFHIVDLVMKGHLTRLQRQVEEQALTIRELEAQLRGGT